MTQYIQLLRRNPGFRLLWSAEVISLLGDWFNTIVLSTLVARFSGGSGLAVSGYLMARFLPPLLVGPFAGVLVDRFDRQRILIYSNILRTGIVLLFLLAMTPNRLWLIYVLTIIQFMVSAIFQPSKSAIVPSLVQRDDLVLANTLSSATWSAMLAIGAIVGGLVGAVFGPMVALSIDAATFAVAGYLISRIHVPPYHAPVDLNDAEAEHDGGSFKDGLRFLIRNPAITALLMVKGGGSLGNVDTLMTIYATEIFILGTNGQLSLGIMYSAFGIGAVLGPLLMNTINDGSIPRMTSLIAVGFAFAFIGWILLGLGTTLIAVAAAILIRAMGGSVNWTYSSVMIQKTVPDRYLGRVFALDFASFELATVVSIIVHGSVIDWIRSQIMMAEPLLNLYKHTPLEELLRSTHTLTTANLQTLTFGTALVSLIPFILWLSITPRMKRKYAEPAVTTEAATNSRKN